MDQRDNPSQEFDLEDILKEFGSPAEDVPGEALPDDAEAFRFDIPADSETAEAPDAPATDTAEEVPAEEESPAGACHAVPLEEPADPAMAGDTVRLDDLRQAVLAGEAPADAVQTDSESPAGTETTEAPGAPQFDTNYAAPAPIPFRSHRSRLRELKKKLVAGPEKRYYELSEKGLGKLQLAIILNILIVVACAAATAMFAYGLVPANRLRLLIFTQALAMLVSALTGSNCLIKGLTDLFKARFTLNTMLLISFIVCCVDAVFCLQQLRVPCCAAFCLEMVMALWNRYQLRSTEIGQMDTMRKATRLDSIVRSPEFHEGRDGLLRGEGQVEDILDNYDAPSGPEKVQCWYTFISFLLCAGISVLAGMRHDSLSLAIQVLSTSLLVAVPASFFVALSRPMGVLERRLHMVGTVLCGWQGVKGLCGKAAFPIADEDIFPAGSTKLNGVKFYGDRNPDQVIAYATALIRANGGGLEPVFSQLLKNRNGQVYTLTNFRDYGTGGIGGEILGESVLLGTPDFLETMGVEIPDGTMVSQAVYCAIDGSLSAVFAISYAKMKSAAAGLVTLCGYRKLIPVLVCDDFMLTESFLRSKFGVNTRRIAFPAKEVRDELAKRKPEADLPALALTTRDGLAPTAYAITGSRALRTACTLGLVIHMLGGILGMLIMLVLAYLGSAELLTPVNVLLYQLVWLVPGLLITEWTRTV